MKSLSRLALVVVAVLAVSQNAPASTSTPLGNGGFSLFVDDLTGFRASTFTDNASPQAKAIDKALTLFADTSTTFSEDLNDARIALKGLRKVFGSNSTTLGDFVWTLNRDATGIPLAVTAVANVAYANASLKTRLGVGLKIQKAGGTANEQSRYAKFKAVMKGVEAYARKRHIDLNVAH